MGLIAKGLCWKLLDSISESESPSAFIAFYEAIKKAAIRNDLDFSVDDPLMADSSIHKQMAEAIGRSLEPRPAILPSVGHTISIQGESWHVVLNATATPHLKAAVVERKPRTEEETAYRFRLVRDLVDHGEVDFGKIGDEQLHGKTWELYLFCKIRKLKVLRESFAKRPYRKQPILLAPNQTFLHLTATLPSISTIKDDAGGVRKFLDECDRVLVEQVGQEKLIRYLEGCGIPPKDFLWAQRTSILGMRF